MNPEKLEIMTKMERLLNDIVAEARTRKDKATCNKALSVRGHLDSLRQIETIGHVWVPSKDGMTLPKAK